MITHLAGWKVKPAERSIVAHLKVRDRAFETKEQATCFRCGRKLKHPIGVYSAETGEWLCYFGEECIGRFM